jgi:hypothetical protein
MPTRFKEIGVLELPDASIDGIEVTQTIQYYKSARHLTDPALRGEDNSIILAADKPAWVRTYVRTGRLAPLAGVKGILTLERRRLGFLWDIVATINPQSPGSVTARPFIDYATERGSVYNTLNFIIPAGDCHGYLRLTVQLVDPEGKPLGSSSTNAMAILRQALRIRGIMIGYNGPSTAVMSPGAPPPPNLTLAAPTLADLQSTASRALLAMPVQSKGNFAVASQITFDLPLDDPRIEDGKCSKNWGTLLNRLATERTNDGNRSDVVYYGLLPAGMPLGVPGCGGNGLGAGGVGDLATLLHEIGHGYGFDHTPCGAAGTTDPNYPNYTPYASASIGEYGLDISNGTVLSPAITRDYMSYCFPQWMSLYQHSRLVGHARLDPSWITDPPIHDQYVEFHNYIIPEYIPDPPGDPWRVAQMRPDPVISIIGVVRSSREIEVTSVARIRAVSTPQGEPVELRARLLDRDGKELARAALCEIAAHGTCGCCGGSARTKGEPPYTFQAMIPDAAAGSALVIEMEGEQLWRRDAPPTPPSIEAVHAKVVGRTLLLSWEAKTSSKETDLWVQWSNIEGKVWHGLATHLMGREAEVSIAGLPSGRALIRVLLHDGFYTVTSEPVEIDVPERGPEIAILTPRSGRSYLAGSTMRLWASVTDSAGSHLPDEVGLWLVDGREVGRGTDLWIIAPAPGEHRASLIVRFDGSETRAETRFTTIGRCQSD